MASFRATWPAGRAETQFWTPAWPQWRWPPFPNPIRSPRSDLWTKLRQNLQTSRFSVFIFVDDFFGQLYMLFKMCLQAIRISCSKTSEWQFRLSNTHRAQSGPRWSRGCRRSWPRGKRGPSGCKPRRAETQTGLKENYRCKFLFCLLSSSIDVICSRFDWNDDTSWIRFEI